MAYTFDAISAIDPDDPSRVASNAAVTIFAPGDAAMTLIALTDTSGVPLENPITVNELGFGPAFMADIDRVAWSSADLGGFFTSYEGLKNEAVIARGAAQTAATDANDSKLAAEAIANRAAPLGGNTGQVLTKTSNADGDMAWLDGGGSSLPSAGVMVNVAQVGNGYTRPSSDPTIIYVFTGTADPSSVALENDWWARIT